MQKPTLHSLSYGPSSVKYWSMCEQVSWLQLSLCFASKKQLQTISIYSEVSATTPQFHNIP